MDSSIDKTRNQLRKRLDQLGYRLHFGMDSVPLVAKLFSDLVHTTVSLRDAKLSSGKPERRRYAVSPELPYMTVLTRQLDSGDHFNSTGGKKISIALLHQSTQTIDVRPPPCADNDDLYERLVELQEELVTLKSELDFSHGRTKAVTGQLAEAQEAKRKLERTLKRTLEELRRTRSDEAAEMASCDEERKDDAVAQMVAVKERVLNMAYRKLSASREVILGQQEVIQDLEENLSKIKAEVCEQSRLREKLAQERGRNDKLEGLLAFLEAEKSALQDKVDKMMANDRDLVLGLDLPRATMGGGGDGPTPCLAGVLKSLEEERDRYRREAQRYQALLRPTAPTAATT